MPKMTVQEKRAQIAEWEKSLKSDLKALYDQAKSQRTVTRSKLTKSINSLNACLRSTDAYEIQESLNDVITWKKEEEERSGQVQMCMVDHAAILDADADIQQQSYIDPSIKIIGMARQRIKHLHSTATPPTPGTPGTPSTPGAQTSKVRLPKIDLPKFKGESPAEYSCFLNKFNSLVDSDPGLDNIQKLMYLQSCCSGEAARISEGYAVTADNYRNLLQAFKQMFGLKRLIIQSYMEKVLDLPNCSTIGLKQFLNTIDTTVRSLGEHGVTSAQIAPCIIPIIERKLTKADFTKWRELIFEDDDFSLEKLIKFLHERLLCQPSDYSVGEKKKESSQPKVHTTQFLSTGAQDNCFICGYAHHTTQCRKFLKANPQNRFEMARSAYICFKCLNSTDHGCYNCQAEPCSCCGKNHHDLLHLQEKVSQQGKTTINASHNMHSTKLLKTLVVKPFEHDFYLRAIIDGGSEENWVTRKIVNKLDLSIKGTTLSSIAFAFQDEYTEPQEIDIVDLSLQDA